MNRRQAKKLHRKAMTMNQPPKPPATKEPSDAPTVSRVPGLPDEGRRHYRAVPWRGECAEELAETIIDFVHHQDTTKNDLDMILNFIGVLQADSGAHTPSEAFITSLVQAHGLKDRLARPDIERMYGEFCDQHDYMRKMFTDIYVQYPDVAAEIINDGVVDLETVR